MLVESYDGKIWVEDHIKGDHTKGSKFILLIKEFTTSFWKSINLVICKDKIIEVDWNKKNEEIELIKVV